MTTILAFVILCGGQGALSSSETVGVTPAGRLKKSHFKKMICEQSHSFLHHQHSHLLYHKDDENVVLALKEHGVQWWEEVGKQD